MERSARDSPGRDAGFDAGATRCRLIRSMKQIFLLYYANALDRTPEASGRPRHLVWRDAQLSLGLDLMTALLVPLCTGLFLIGGALPGGPSGSLIRSLIGLGMAFLVVTVSAILTRASSGRYREIAGLRDDWRSSAQKRTRYRTFRLVLWTPFALCLASVIVYQLISKLT
jgi:hypothetical protein